MLRSIVFTAIFATLAAAGLVRAEEAARPGAPPGSGAHANSPARQVGAVGRARARAIASRLDAPLTRPSSVASRRPQAGGADDFRAQAARLRGAAPPAPSCGAKLEDPCDTGCEKGLDVGYNGMCAKRCGRNTDCLDTEEFCDKHYAVCRL